MFPLTSEIYTPLPFMATDSEPDCIGLESRSLGASNYGSSVWPTANLAIFIPFVMRKPTIVDRMFVFNGSAGIPSDNIDLGIYHGQTLARLGSTGAVAQAGTTTQQVIALTADTLVPRGFHFMAMSMNGTPTGTTFRETIQASITYKLLTGCMEMGTAHPLPDPAVLTVPANIYIPYIGLIPKGIPS